MTRNGCIDVDDLLVIVNNWGICPAGSSSQSFRGGSNSLQSPDQLLEFLDTIPEIPQEVMEQIQTVLGL